MNATAMRAGHRRYIDAQHREAVRRVRAFQAWLRAGSPLRAIPPIPSDHDYRIARGERP